MLDDFRYLATVDKPYTLSYEPSRAVGPCPVKVIGISSENLQGLYVISPTLETKLRAISHGGSCRRPRVSKY